MKKSEIIQILSEKIDTSLNNTQIAESIIDCLLDLGMQPPPIKTEVYGYKQDNQAKTRTIIAYKWDAE